MIVYLSIGMANIRSNPLSWIEGTLNKGNGASHPVDNLYDMSATPDESIRRRVEVTGHSPQFAYGFKLERVP